MASQYLIINIGSRSKKYALYSESGELLRAEHLEGERYREAIPVELLSAETVVGIRVVAPGEYFLTHRLVDQDYLSQLQDAALAAPLHVAPVLGEIEALRQAHPDLTIYALSDSAFLASRPEVSKLYGLPLADARDHHLYRYGYHGLSMASASRRLQAYPELKRVIVCHLGGGVSVVALREGAVADTSMGYSPLEGPVMSTRVGSIDVGAVLALARAKNCSPAELEAYFNNNCGLLGVSGRSESVRDLLALEGEDANAKLALDLFAWSVKKSIGSSLALLGGVDALVFTATIGERSAPMRERILAGLADLGLSLDLGKNQAVPDPVGAEPVWIQSSDSRAQIGVLASNEQAEMLGILRGLSVV